MSLQLRCLDNRRYSLALVLTLLLLTATPGTSGTSGTSGHSDVAMNITAVLGHSVTFKCPSTHSKPVNGLYIQRMKNDKEVFINGFYKGHPMPVNSEYQNRTKVNEMELSMEMRNISVSDEGLYKCVVFYSTLDKMETMINLKVTAEYSVPTIKKDCIKRNDGSTGESCQLSCSAVGGYPQSTVTWVGLNSSEMSGFYNRNLADNVSETWTINQTIIFNCDQPISVSCAIADAVSYTITICEKESFSLQVIIAIIVVLAFVLLILVIIVMKCCCRRSETRRLEDQVDGADIPLA
ncbi:T-lymphocyte activation antigen CD80 [Labeo rohita]|uniref:T-lymphocyte activation antigen CD80 n=1 Tax=Labeo rohita TaxID=84645 RepID=A0ABQ8M0S8_LABRO|nr:T-lymphocyte activation antigen CD80 [Labeo rohita]